MIIPSFAMAGTETVTDFIGYVNSSSSTNKAVLIKNINAGIFIAQVTSDGSNYIYVPTIDLTSSGVVTFSGGHFFTSSNSSVPVSAVDSISSVYPISLFASYDFYSDSVILASTYTLKGSLSDFFPRPPEPAEVVYQLTQVPVSSLMTRFSAALLILFVVALAIFSTLLLLPLIPRVIQSFLH